MGNRESRKRGISISGLEISDPEDLGFSRDRLSRAMRIVCIYTENGSIPGIEILVIRAGKIALHEACGYAEKIPSSRALVRGMLFDLASLTKPLAGSIVAGYLVSEGLFHLKQRVSEIIPGFSRTPSGYSEVKDRIKVWMLLSHSSGLPQWLPLYRLARNREEVFEETMRVFPSYSPGSGALYSDLGYILLTRIAEQVSGERFDVLFNKVVARKLGLARTLYNPLDAGFTGADIVSTEPIEGKPLTGVVHDENARAMGGVSAHAGLFSTAIEVGKISLEILSSYRSESDLLLPPAYTRSMLRRWACGDRCYGLGWWIYDRRAVEAAGDMLSRGYGHTGFTGTSVWIDPELDLVVVLLTNRIHFGRDNRAIDRLRPVAHNLIMASLKRL